MCVSIYPGEILASQSSIGDSSLSWCFEKASVSSPILLLIKDHSEIKSRINSEIKGRINSEINSRIISNNQITTWLSVQL